MTMFMFEEFRRAAFPYKEATLSNVHDWYIIQSLKEQVAALGEVGRSLLRIGTGSVSPGRPMFLCQHITLKSGVSISQLYNTLSNSTTSLFLAAWWAIKLIFTLRLTESAQ